jgi:hypothetical protein
MNRFNVSDILPKPVRLDQIDETPGIYCMSYGYDITRLSDSISRIGLVNTPILMKRGEGEGDLRFEVVSGFRRIIALKTLKGKGSVPCRILPPETPPLECLVINLYDNLCVRDFNAVEKGMVLGRLLKWVPAEEVVRDFMPLLDLPAHEETLHLFLGIEKDFEREAKDLLANGNLSTLGAKHLLEMNAAARTKFCEYFSIVKFSKNQQIQFIEFINDLSHIENKTVTQLLDDRQLVRVRDSDPMNAPQKAKALIKLLRTRRMPHLVRAEKGFRYMIEKLALPTHYRISPPPFFEGPDYHLDISFEDGRDLLEKLSVLIEKKGISELEDPWHKGF